MAKYTRTLRGDFDSILRKIVNGVQNASVSATLEDAWDCSQGGARCSVRVFERYSYAGGNRVSMSVTLVQTGDTIQLCAITSGGSQAMFWKVNTWGEETFLDTLKDLFV